MSPIFVVLILTCHAGPPTQQTCEALFQKEPEGTTLEQCTTTQEMLRQIYDHQEPKDQTVRSIRCMTLSDLMANSVMKDDAP